MLSNVCPVCGYPSLEEPSYDETGSPSYEICPSCGTEFGYHDAMRSHAELRAIWREAGYPWRDAEPPPKDWDPLNQLRVAGLD